MAVSGVSSTKQENQARDAAAAANRSRASERAQAQSTKAFQSSAPSQKPRQAEANGQPTNRGGESSKASSYRHASGPGGALSGGSGVGRNVNVRA